MCSLSLALGYEECFPVCGLPFQLFTLVLFLFWPQAFHAWLLALVSHLEQQSVPQDYAHIYRKGFI